MKTYQPISNEHAFDPAKMEVPEKNIPHISLEGTQFTRRWFIQRNQKTWSSYFPARFASQGAVNMIQIGVFEGMDLLWCLQHIVGGGKVLGIDPWLKTRKLDQEKMDAVRSAAYHNLSPWIDNGQLKLVQGFSGEVLELDKWHEPKSVDLIVIDGDHMAPAVYEDAHLSLKYARKGAWLVFDDVRQRIPKPGQVEDGLRQFLADYGDRVKLVAQHRYSDIFEVL